MQCNAMKYEWSAVMESNIKNFSNVPTVNTSEYIAQQQQADEQQQQQQKQQHETHFTKSCCSVAISSHPLLHIALYLGSLSLNTNPHSNDLQIMPLSKKRKKEAATTTYDTDDIWHFIFDWSLCNWRRFHRFRSAIAYKTNTTLRLFIRAHFGIRVLFSQMILVCLLLFFFVNNDIFYRCFSSTW